MIRRGLFALTLVSAVGVPYALWNGHKLPDSLGSLWSSDDAGDAANGDQTTALTQGSELVPLGPDDVSGRIQMESLAISVTPDRATSPEQPVPPIAGANVNNLAEVLNWNVTRPWVRSRWARVSTSLADTELAGLRVALVTGTQPSDLSGALTYYFDKNGKVQRISFHGHTGDPAKLVAVLSGQFNMQSEPGLDEALYVARNWRRQPQSVCSIRTAPVMWANSPNTRLEVLLEINRPAWKQGLSASGEALLAGNADDGWGLW